MEFLSELWLPIVASAGLVFVVSSVMHMVLPIHKGDHRKLPSEDAARAALRGAPPGEYLVPWAGSMKEMGSPEMRAKYQEGPVAVVTMLRSGPCSLGKPLAFWFLYSLLVGVFVAYLTRVALGPGAGYHAVFRFAGTVAALGYGVPHALQDSIWRGRPWSTSLKFLFDGLVYGLVTAGVFGWLWPDA